MTVISNGLFLLIISKNNREQQNLRMIWCKRHKDRNWDDVMFSDE